MAAGAIRSDDDRGRGKEMEARVRTLNWTDLLALYEGVEAGDTPGWPRGRAFEYLVLRCFELDGARVTYPFRVTEQGETLEEIDGAFQIDGRAYLVETKDREAGVQIAPIAKLRNQLLRRPAGVVGIVFARSGFTAPARTLASYCAPQAVLLWEGAELKWLLERAVETGRSGIFIGALDRKVSAYVERAIAAFDVREVPA